MRYLVTGGAGFIGSHIVEKLIKEGYYVRVLDNLSTGKEENLRFVQELGRDKFEFIFGDICSPETCNRACKDIDYFLFQSALKSVPESFENPIEYNNVNVIGLINMLQASVNNRIKRFVFASSSSVYGDTKNKLQKECESLGILEPLSPYALTKLTGEHYCRIFSRFYDLETICLRYFNVFGSRQALDDEYSVVIPKFIRCMQSNLSCPIFGNGKQSRDFIHVSDVVTANILACQAPVIHQATFNVGTGKAISILELVETLNKIMNKNNRPIFNEEREGDILISCADIKKIQNSLNFKPTTEFDKGLEEAIKYYVR